MSSFKRVLVFFEVLDLKTLELRKFQAPHQFSTAFYAPFEEFLLFLSSLEPCPKFMKTIPTQNVWKIWEDIHTGEFINDLRPPRFCQMLH